MSKFKKKKKGMPAISTASLPDIVFMLLFFFMVSTTTKPSGVLVTNSIPVSGETKKLEQQNLVSTIYIGKAFGNKYGNSYNTIQLNDKIVTDVKRIKEFIFEERRKVKQEQVPLMETAIKADKKMEMGVLTDIRKELQNVNALKVRLIVSPAKAD